MAINMYIEMIVLPKNYIENSRGWFYSGISNKGVR